MSDNYSPEELAELSKMERRFECTNPDCKQMINRLDCFCWKCGTNVPLPPTLVALDLQEFATCDHEFDEKHAHINFCSNCGKNLRSPQ